MDSKDVKQAPATFYSPANLSVTPFSAKPGKTAGIQPALRITFKEHRAVGKIQLSTASLPTITRSNEKQKPHPLTQSSTITAPLQRWKSEVRIGEKNLAPDSAGPSRFPPEILLEFELCASLIRNRVKDPVFQSDLLNWLSRARAVLLAGQIEKALFILDQIIHQAQLASGLSSRKIKVDFRLVKSIVSLQLRLIDIL